MKSLKEYQEDIYKCSRCALCQSVCPVYKATLNECAVSKGKFNMLNGIVNGDLKISKQLKKYLDMCTGCNACKDFCPSGIDAKRIFIAAKNEYYQSCKLSFLEKFLTSYSIFRIALFSAKIGFFFYRLFQMDKIIHYFESCFLNLGELGKRLVLLNSLARKTYKPQRKTSAKANKTVIYFEGCINKYINADSETAVKDILANSGIKFVKRKFECCGISYLSDGNFKKFKKLANKNLTQLDCDFDYILTDCASCYSVLKEYKEFIPSKTAEIVNKKIIGILDLISNMNFVLKKPFKVAVHVPCHEEFDIKSFVENIGNLQYVNAEDFDKCCGFAGTFAAKNQKISKEISRKKAQNYIDSGANVILTTCPACTLGLEQGLAEINTKKQKPIVMNLFVFLAKYCVFG